MGERAGARAHTHTHTHAHTHTHTHTLIHGRTRAFTNYPREALAVFSTNHLHMDTCGNGLFKQSNFFLTFLKIC